MLVSFKALRCLCLLLCYLCQYAEDEGRSVRQSTLFVKNLNFKTSDEHLKEVCLSSSRTHSSFALVPWCPELGTCSFFLSSHNLVSPSRSQSSLFLDFTMKPARDYEFANDKTIHDIVILTWIFILLQVGLAPQLKPWFLLCLFVICVIWWMHAVADDICICWLVLFLSRCFPPLGLLRKLPLPRRRTQEIQVLYFWALVQVLLWLHSLSSHNFRARFSVLVGARALLLSLLFSAVSEASFDADVDVGVYRNK